MRLQALCVLAGLTSVHCLLQDWGQMLSVLLQLRVLLEEAGLGGVRCPTLEPRPRSR